jgi:hypothetical protein
MLLPGHSTVSPPRPRAAMRRRNASLHVPVARVVDLPVGTIRSRSALIAPASVIGSLAAGAAGSTQDQQPHASHTRRPGPCRHPFSLVRLAAADPSRMAAAVAAGGGGCRGRRWAAAAGLGHPGGR